MISSKNWRIIFEMVRSNAPIEVIRDYCYDIQYELGYLYIDFYQQGKENPNFDPVIVMETKTLGEAQFRFGTQLRPTVQIIGSIENRHFFLERNILPVSINNHQDWVYTSDFPGLTPKVLDKLVIQALKQSVPMS